MTRYFVALGMLVAACGCEDGDKRGDKDKERRVLASVNGMPIYVDEFLREFHRIRLNDEEGGPSVASDNAQKRTLLDDLIERRLTMQEAEKSNVLVGIEEVEVAYERTRAGWDVSEVDKLLESKDITAAEMKRELRELLMLQKYFRDHVFSRVAVTDEEISRYIEAHPETQILPEEVHALQIVVKTEEKAQEISQQIKKGMPFEEAATKYSLSPEAKNGGDLGSFARGSMPSIFDEVCFGLKVGEISKVVASDYGFHLFKVVERRPEALKPVDRLRDEIEKKLRREKEREAQTAKIQDLKRAAKIVIEDKELARVH
ncbi:MAG: peptidylprolyl isomerase [Deltaproteobacteria bacterium]|nr:peptidylprolyl isomerase [Deltaproteobacteria bacterium]